MNVAGWRLTDDDGNVFVFPDHVMQPSQSCRVYTNENHPQHCSFSFRSGRAIWGNSGDVALLYDPSGRLVDSQCWRSGC